MFERNIDYDTIGTPFRDYFSDSHRNSHHFAKISQPFTPLNSQPFLLIAQTLIHIPTQAINSNQ